ncbi:MAG: peptide-methionine (R)-S-oxide reductase MsrB [Parvularculaceae bacterium]
MRSTRRRFLTIAAAGAAGAAQGCGARDAEARADDRRGDNVTEPDPALIPDYDKWRLSEDEWRKRLSPEAFQVLRREGTERPGSSPLDDEKRAGIFACAGCGLPLFSSETKFDSGTGWPSFFDHLPNALGTKSDYKLIVPRTEYHCARCGGHQGHVFRNGPEPTGLRYCNNGVALTFTPEDGEAA